MAIDTNQSQREHRHFEQDKEMIRQQVIHYLIGREYMSLNELVDKIRAPKVEFLMSYHVVIDSRRATSSSGYSEEGKEH